MSFFDRVKAWLDWGKRIEFLSHVVILFWTGAFIASARAYLLSHANISPLWRPPAYLFAASAALVSAMFFGNIWAKKSASEKLPPNVKYDLMKATLYFSLQGDAKELEITLSILWHHWVNEGEKLIYPLDIASNKITSPSITADKLQTIYNEHRDFLVLYSNHMNSLSNLFPDFTSLVTEAGYPSKVVEYPVVLRNLQSHQEKLKAEGDRIWESY